MINFNVRLPDDLYDRLDALADQTGRTKSYYVLFALKDMLEEHEDYLEALAAIEEIKEDKTRIVSHEDVKNDIDYR